MKKIIATLTSIALLVPCLALAGDRSELQALEASKISLSDAIALAEKEIGGKAVEAGIDDDSLKPEIEVSVVKDGKFYDVRIDAEKGVVIGSREDIDD